MLLFVCIGIFKDQPLDSSFTWHPVLMTLAFPFCMVLGRWSYKCDDYGILVEKIHRRRVHAVLMASAGVFALLGYIGVFLAHWPNRQFFGFSFILGEFEENPTRIAHAIFGYVVLLSVAFQAIIGVTKYKSDTKIYTFHGTVGKFVIFGGAFEIFLAIIFWGGWGTMEKIRLTALLVLTTMFATILPMPSPSAVEKDETDALVKP